MTQRNGPGRLRKASTIAGDQRQAWKAELARQARTRRGHRGSRTAPGYRPGMGRVIPAAAPQDEADSGEHDAQAQ